jgi:hypothetical protein
MTVDRISGSDTRHVAPPSTLVLDGLFTGMIGALIVALWFLVLDLAGGHAFYTPALLGTVLLHGGAAAASGPVIAPLEIAAYTAFHFLSFLIIGYLLSWLMTLFERFPIVFFVILVVFVCLQFAFFAVNVALGAQLLGHLRAWSVVGANVLAAFGMGFYQWKRHPGALEHVERLWQDDAQ